jgi:phosphoadenosine phosphosulfate reductase
MNLNRASKASADSITTPQEKPSNNNAEREFDPTRISALNEKYRPLSIEQRVGELYKDFDIAKVMLTSSFAATSAFLLHVFSRFAPDQPVFFIDTGFHFPQTLEYKQKLIELYRLKVVDVHAEDWKHKFTVTDETWKKDPDFCCSINKVEPLYSIKSNYDVWASGLMRWQTDHRSTLDVFEVRGGIIKFYPLIDVTREQRDAYIEEHKLPFHPLVAIGYSSIGCTHCTVAGTDRSGRWNNSPKTECGLHL